MIRDDSAAALEVLRIDEGAADEAVEDELYAPTDEVAISSAELMGILLDAITELDTTAVFDEAAPAVKDTGMESVGVSPIFTHPDLAVSAAGQLTSSQSTLGRLLTSIGEIL